MRSSLVILIITVIVSFNGTWSIAQTPGIVVFNEAVSISAETTPINTPSGYRLYVADGILTEKLRIANKSGANWADFVFAPTYKLQPLPEVKTFIECHGHLPGVPSAAEVEKHGIDVADTQRILLQKIEELTLYVIKQQQEIAQQDLRVNQLSKDFRRFQVQKSGHSRR